MRNWQELAPRCNRVDWAVQQFKRRRVVTIFQGLLCSSKAPSILISQLISIAMRHHNTYNATNHRANPDHPIADRNAHSAFKQPCSNCSPDAVQ